MDIETFIKENNFIITDSVDSTSKPIKVYTKEFFSFGRHVRIYDIKIYESNKRNGYLYQIGIAQINRSNADFIETYKMALLERDQMLLNACKNITKYLQTNKKIYNKFINDTKK